MSLPRKARVELDIGEQDITEHIQVLYDIAHSSMDWGSGFLDHDEMCKVIEVARIMGFEAPPIGHYSPINNVFVEKFPDLYRVEPAPTEWNPGRQQIVSIPPEERKPHA